MTQFAQTEWMSPNNDQGSDETTVDMGRYVLRRVLATGGLGKVWLAHDRELRRDIALKEIQRPLVGRTGIEEQFQIEALVTGQLEHPGIVTVHDIGRFPDGRLYYCMKLVQGPTLRAGLREMRGLETNSARCGRRRELIDAFLDVCQAIAYAHSRGVLHLDLKPENIILGAFGDTQVLDWGLAKLRDPGDHTARPLTGLVGTPRYMSPEQIKGQESELSPAADIYALGVILIEIFLACDKRSLPVPDMENLEDSPRRLLTVLNRLPPPIRSIARKAIAIKAEDRFADPIQLAQEIQRYLNHERVLVHREGMRIGLQRWIRQHPTTSTIAALLMVAAACWQWRIAEGRRQAHLLVDTVLMQAKVDWKQGRPELALERLQIAEDQLATDQADPSVRGRVQDPRGQLRQWIAFDRALEQARFLSVDDARRSELVAACNRAKSYAGSALPLGFEAPLVAEQRRRALEELELLAHWAERDNEPSEPRSPHSPSDPYLQGRELLLAHEFDAAADRFQSVLRVSPDHFWATYFLAYSRQRQGDSRAAIIGYSACLARYPNVTFISLQRAAAFESLGDIEAAADDYQRAAHNDPSDPYAQYGLVVASFAEGDLETGSQRLEQLLHDHPRFSLAILERARLRRRLGKLKWARADCDQLLGRRELEAEVLIERAQISLDENNPSEARADLELSQTLEPNLPLAAATEGLLCAAEGKIEQAIAAHERAHQLAPEDPRLWNNWVAALLDAGYVKQAEQQARRLIGQRPQYWLAQGNLIAAMIRRNAPAEELRAAVRGVPLVAKRDRLGAARQMRMFETIAAHPLGHLADPHREAIRAVCNARIAELRPIVGQFAPPPAAKSVAENREPQIHLYPPLEVKPGQ